jgi:hypothetical protein
MQTMSINVARQFAADRQAEYEGIAARRRLRRLVRRSSRDRANHPQVVRRTPALVLTSHDGSAAKVTTRKVA